MRIILHSFSRFFHSSGALLAAEKSALATLRKKTGYTFANCKKALDMHQNDLPQAEQWLQQQAQALGWSKATKLEGRQTTQGLVGVAVDNNIGVLVEINCETDFVSRNKEFEKMVKEATETCLNFVKNSPSSSDFVTKVGFDAEQLKQLKVLDGKTLADKLALLIGLVGENASLKRALGFKVQNGIYLTGYAHPSGKISDNVLFGRIGGLVALKSLHTENTNVAEIGKGLCQHIVGMAPKRIGQGDEKIPGDKGDESVLIHQDYLLDDAVSVKDLLENNQIEVIDFKRFECGETVEAIGVQPLDTLNTCQ